MGVVGASYPTLGSRCEWMMVLLEAKRVVTHGQSLTGQHMAPAS